MSIYTTEYNDPNVKPIVMTEADMVFVLDMLDTRREPTPELIRAAAEWFGLDSPVS